MKNIVTFLLSILVFTAVAQTKSIQQSPPLTTASATRVGMSAERLDRIDGMLNEAIEKNEIPGAVALVARNGKIIYQKAFGMSDIESERAFKVDDVFRLASQTKAITATAVMILWEEGKFRMDDPISKYIPEFAAAQLLDSFIEKDSSYTTIAASKQMTIRHLITHTSGIGYGGIDRDKRFTKIYKKAGIIDGFSTAPETIKENIQKLAKLPLHFNPGEQYSYSLGYDVLGYFVEVMSGMSLDQFFKERIFNPLDMKNTWFYMPQSEADRLVPLYTKNKEKKWIKMPPVAGIDASFPIHGARTYFSGGAGLSSTAKDYATFLQMYLNNGELNGIRLLSRTTVQFMMGNQIGDLWGDQGEYYGLAFGVLDQKGANMGGRGSLGTFEWAGFFNTEYFADPKEQIIGILMKQTLYSGADNTDWKFQQLVGQAVDD